MVKMTSVSSVMVDGAVKEAAGCWIEAVAEQGGLVVMHQAAVVPCLHSCVLLLLGHRAASTQGGGCSVTIVVR